MKKSPINVLWVEDSIDDVDIFSMAFKKANARLKFDVKIDGAEAIEHLMSIRTTPALHPDVILLDLNLPKRDGREVLADIKKCEELRSIPVVILTTSNADPDVARAYALG